MSYVKQTWQTGDVVTSAKLNHMEDGIAAAGSVLVVHDVDGTLDKTWQEIHDALPLVCAMKNEGYYKWVEYATSEEGEFYTGFFVVTPGGTVKQEYFASSADGYPAAQGG